MTDLWRLSAAQLTEGYRSAAFTPVDALDACLLRLKACEPVLNAMVFVDGPGACRAAEASTRRWAQGHPLGALDGVPVSVKDNLHVADQPTRWGSRLLEGFVARHDELPVARLRAAGAVLLGKSNLPEFAAQGHTTNLVSGTTRNPWNPALTPGGSSGGAAAAVAAGYGPLALATDGGGSIRRPASHAGLVGFKPSAGCVARGGGLPEIFLDYEVVGGIGRNVPDVTTMLEVLADVPLAAGAPEALRILFVPRFGDAPVDPGIAAVVYQAAKQFEDLGHVVEEAARFDLADEVNARWPLVSAIGLTWLFGHVSRFPELFLDPEAGIDPTLCGEGARTMLQAGQAVPATELFDLLAAVQRLGHRLAELFSRYAVVLTPATAALPWPVEASHPATIDGRPAGPRGHATFTAIANAGGLPAVAVPSGFVDGLPTGFQLLGPRGADAGVLALAGAYESAFPIPDGRPEFRGAAGEDILLPFKD